MSVCLLGSDERITTEPWKGNNWTMVLAILWYRWLEEKLDLCATPREVAGRSKVRVEWGLIQVRLTINTVLSSISASSPFSRRWLSCCTAQSSNALHIS